ncbi:hypothetical protein FMO001_23090 [Moritella sp. F1]|nr:hypothetical protein FMO001_23090 [Moritella sp. F1]
MMQGINLNNFDLDNVKHIDANNIDVLNMKVGEDLFVSRDTTIGRDLVVTGNQKIKGDQTVAGNQTITGKSTFKSDATFDKDVVINGKIDAKGGISSGSTQIVDADGTLYDQGVKVRDIYSQLKGDNKFDGNNSFTGETSFVGGINSVGDIISTGAVKASSFVENGLNLESKYLGISATAINADKLGDVAANQYSRIDQQNTFTAVNRFLNNVVVDKKITAASFKGGTFDGTEISGTEFIENGQSLKDRYLGVDATAKNALNADNADNLGGVAAEKFARRDQFNKFIENAEFEKNLTVSGLLNADQGIKVGGTTVIDKNGVFYDNGKKLSDIYSKLNGNNEFNGSNSFVGNTEFKGRVNSTSTINAARLSENNVLLSKKYLGINATAANSHQLGGVAAGNYVRRDAENVFFKTQRFKENVNVDNDITANAVTARTLRASGKVVTASVEASDVVEGGVSLTDKYLGIDATANKALNAEKLGDIAAANYARLDVGNTFQGVSIFNSQGQFKQNVVVGGMLTASSINVGGVVTAADFSLKTAIGGKKSLTEALTWIKDCESQKIDACKSKQSSTPPPVQNYAFGFYLGSSGGALFTASSGDKANRVLLNKAHYGSRVKQTRRVRKGSGREGYWATETYYVNGGRSSGSYSIRNSTIKGAKVQWKIGNSVKWTGNIGQQYTPLRGLYSWTVSVLDSKNKVISSSLVRIGNHGYQHANGGVYY